MTRQLSLNSVEVEITAKVIRSKYKELFNEVGLLKGCESKLNVDNSVKQIAQPVRRIPFGVREKVEKTLDELLACGIIEDYQKKYQMMLESVLT